MTGFVYCAAAIEPQVICCLLYTSTDGLIHAGSGLDQVTWMDVRVGDWVATPRHGKPVEINAL